MTRVSTLLTVGIIGGMLCSAESAVALGPAEIEIAARGGVASNSDVTGTNPFGIGGRAGVSIRRLYVGASMMYYFGSSIAGTSPNVEMPSLPPAAYTGSQHALMGGPEAGYDFAFGSFLLRPQLGVGMMFLNERFSRPAYHDFSDYDNDNLYFEPGVTALLPLDFEPVFLGADANLLYVPALGSQTVAFTAHAQLGVRF